jgi:hypothetical protein
MASECSKTILETTFGAITHHQADTRSTDVQDLQGLFWMLTSALWVVPCRPHIWVLLENGDVLIAKSMAIYDNLSAHLWNIRVIKHAAGASFWPHP